MDFIIIPQERPLHLPSIDHKKEPLLLPLLLQVRVSEQGELSMPGNKILLLVFALVLLFQTTSCRPGRLHRHEDPSCSAYIRKALLETTLDYDYGKANGSHEPPKKGKPGIGGKP